MEKILVVDDNKYIRFALSTLLDKSGFKVTAVGDGEKALKEVKLKKPDLVILDIRLPGMDGMQVLGEIKNIDGNIPVIMLTAHGNVKAAERAAKSGAYEFVNKPFDNEEIVELVREALNSRLKPPTSDMK